MDMELILQKIRKTFTPRKTVDFDDAGLHFEIEPLTSMDEIKVTESLKDMEGGVYIEALKKHSLAYSIKKIMITEESQTPLAFDLSREFIDYLDKDGIAKTKSSFLYMLDFLNQWPSAVIDVLFEAYVNMQQEVESRVRTQSKFEIFRVSEKPSEDKEPKMRKIREEDTTITEDLTETERLERKVKRELDEADIKIAKNS